MLDVSPLWPADLDHIRLDSPEPERLARFYATAMGMAAGALGDGSYLVRGRQRRLVIGPGAARGNPYNAFALRDRRQLDVYRGFLAAGGVAPVAAPTPLFADGAFAVRDPDGRLVVFGVPKAEFAHAGPAEGLAAPLPGRLQHVVVATACLPALTAFYRDALGFLVSDTVHTGPEGGPPGDTNVCFLRANVEHHSFAAFRAPASAGDHHAYETTSWSDIKLWADHFAALAVPIWWGPGRHGAGNNLFFMVKDPDGNNIELSAELEHLARGQPGKAWPASGRALNLWGAGWNRDIAAG
ncbi:MAG TPA: VOC family protein [Candidatus Sulfotelmatobacter sp.]|nr:VOC family protein [Candidatus Sulfotelmatobacter sp.]